MKLTPFFNGKENDSLWTSVEARDWKQCGFAVPGTSDMDSEKLRKIVGNYINKMYSWLSTKSTPPADLGFPKSMDRVEALIGVSDRKPPPSFEIKAVNAKTASLMTRTLPLTQEAIVVGDRPAVSTEEITGIDKTAFPDGALTGRKQRTWNMHLKVRK